MVRIILVAALALGGVVQVVRSAVVQEMVSDRPEVAAAVWPDHPRVMLAVAMADIGKAASAGEKPSATSVAPSIVAARRAPLAIEPYLIRGAIMQHEGRYDAAERLFVEAARRDPRSAAARFFLAQRFITSGRPEEGLRHASVLVRLVAGGSAALVPAIAQYAKSPDAIPTLRKMFAGDRALRDAVLSELARDADNHDVILALAGDEVGTGASLAAPAWQKQLLGALVARGDFARARAYWLRIGGLGTAPQGIFNPQFAAHAAPPPFNWTFGNGDFGFAEPAPGASLQVMYYGRTNGQLATQTLLLAPGSYELRMRVLRDSEGAGSSSGLAWTVACDKATDALLTLPVGDAEGVARAIAGRFTVPPGCAAQTIRLVGTARDYVATEQLNISDLQLVRHSS